MNPQQVYQKLVAEKIIAEFEQRNIRGHYCASKEQALEHVLGLIPAQAVVSCGGSETLKQLGVIEQLRQGPYTFLDPHAAASTSQKEAIARQALAADVFLMGANALTEAGELVNVDGFGNRVAALIYGPKQVIVVAGFNKIQPDLASAIQRAKTVAARQCLLLFRQDYGSLAELTEAAELAASHLVITSRAPLPGRLQVVLVAESLGF